MSRLTVRRVISASRAELWKRLEGGSLAGRWIAPPGSGGAEGAGKGDRRRSGAGGSTWRESLRAGPFSFEVAGTWAERVPPERSLCLLDGPWGLRVAEEVRLERVAAGTALSLTVDFALGGGGLGEWLDRAWVSGWVSRRLERGISGLEAEYGRPGDGMDASPDVHLERPEDRPWGLDRTGPARSGTLPGGPPGPNPPRPE